MRRLLLLAAAALLARAQQQPPPADAVSPPHAAPTTLPPGGFLFARQASRLSNSECFTTTTIQTSDCPLETSAGRVRTLPCTPTEVASSRCAPGLMCTIDSNNNDICMRRRDNLDAGGIIIAVIMALSIVVAIGSLTFLCCRDRRQQRRLAAKAEATALARAHTKKQRAQEVRAPLMRQTEAAPGRGPSTRGPDPFHDSHP